MHFRDWYDLTRLDHGLLWGAAVLVGESLAYRGIPPTKYAILGFVIPVLVEVGIFALNDYLDLESDILNNRFDRPLTRKVIPQSYPLYLSLAVLPLAVALGAAMKLLSFLIVTSFVVLGVLYDVKLKELPLVKNSIMGACIAAPLVCGNLFITDHLLPVVVILGAAAFTSGFGREVLKDMIDMEGDRVRGCKTFPIIFGMRSSAVMIASLLTAACFFVLLPYFYPFDYFYYHDLFYLVPACATSGLSLFCGYSILKDTSRENVKNLRKKTLVLLEMGILTFVIGALF